MNGQVLICIDSFGVISMSVKRGIYSLAATCGLLILIFDSKTALQGSLEGLALCLRIVIPSLFPFILLSTVVTQGFSGMVLPVLRPIARLFSLPEGAESILIPAFLGGYPVGAQCIGTTYAAGQLPRNTAQRMLTFCSNAGPSFLFGMVGSLFPEKWMVWGLWGIQIFTAWMVSCLFPCGGKVGMETKAHTTSSMASAVHVMGLICGWVIIFRIGSLFLDRWLLWVFPPEVKVAVTGLLELSNGCYALSGIENIRLRFVMASGFLSFGGVCVLMQTASVLRGLSIGSYIRGKGIQTLLSTALSFLVVYGFWYWAALVGVLFLLIPGKIRKSSSNPLSVGV